MQREDKKRHIIIATLVALILFIAFLASLKIENIKIEGNEYLSDEELEAYIFEDAFDYNPIIFVIRGWFEDKTEIPFVEEYDVTMTSLTSCKVTVYEKSIVGYISYMGTYMYFDKDGIVVENSSQSYESIPQITGVDFENIVLYEEIPVENEKVFDIILDVTQLVDKYDVKAYRINISDTLEVKLYIDNYRVALGNDGRYSEKIATFADIMPNMKNIPGELNMTEYDQIGAGYVFKKD